MAPKEPLRRLSAASPPASASRKRRLEVAAAAARPKARKKPFFSKAWAGAAFGRAALQFLLLFPVASYLGGWPPGLLARHVLSAALIPPQGASPSDSHCSRRGSLPDGFLCFGEASED